MSRLMMIGLMQMSANYIEGRELSKQWNYCYYNNNNNNNNNNIIIIIYT